MVMTSLWRDDDITCQSNYTKSIRLWYSNTLPNFFSIAWIALEIWNIFRHPATTSRPRYPKKTQANCLAVKLLSILFWPQFLRSWLIVYIITIFLLLIGQKARNSDCDLFIQLSDNRCPITTFCYWVNVFAVRLTLELSVGVKWTHIGFSDLKIEAVKQSKLNFPYL